MSNDTIRARLLDDGSLVEVPADGSTRPMQDGTDWQRLDALSDEQIDAEIKDDPDAVPALDEEWFRQARKQAISLRIDPDVLEWFKRGGAGYQTRINAVLRAYMESHQAT